MGRTVLTLCFLLLISISHSAFATQKTLNVEACYKEFEQYTPKQVVGWVRAARDKVLKEGKASLKEFDKVSKLTWPNPPWSPLITIINCNRMRSEHFLFDDMRAALSKDGFIKKFVDAEGKHTFFELCNSLKGGGEGRWTLQNHYWPSCEGPLRMGVVLLRIPGTDLFVQSSLVSKSITLEEFNASFK